ncbi:MAG: phosphatase PAP2 family protein [Chitinophagaceae bacterium]|nr:MAG: phosphatase PAP2 family protein [Chitinophagaceae bacterium]
MKNLALALAFCFFMPLLSKSQETDSIEKTSFSNEVLGLDQENKLLPNKVLFKRMIGPALLITYGAFSVDNSYVKGLNSSWRNEVIAMHLGQTDIDDYTQLAPVALVYSLNFSGVKGTNSIGDITIIGASAFIISSAIVRPLKQLTAVRRPDGSNDHSFPSGHTSTAFVSAQFMYREYRDKNFLLSLAGYPFAIYTALYRTVNDKHWLGDIVAGAGIGIASTELAYYLLPHLKNLFKSISKKNVIIYPLYQASAYGLGVNVRL